jgi:rfaE bifunctional protein nucleotidyltransferase chain/domain
MIYEIMDIVIPTIDEINICNLSGKKHINNSPKKNYFNKVNTKPWGKEYLAYQNNKIGIWILHIDKGQETSTHCHFKKDSILLPLQGCFKINLFNSYKILHPLDSLYVSRNIFHGIHAYTNDSILLEVEVYTEQVDYTDKNDLLRLRDIYIRDNDKYETSVCERIPNENEIMNFCNETVFNLKYSKIKIIDISNNTFNMNSENIDKAILLEGNIFINGANVSSGTLLNLKENNYSLLTNNVKLLCFYNLNYEVLNKLIYSNTHLYDYLKLSNYSNIGLTSGCFDIFHCGHIKLLKNFKNMCNKLFVCLSSDNQIKRIKGEKRPINNIDDRLNILMNYSFIDNIILYDETDDIIEKELDIIMNIVKPTIWAKGSDYSINEILKKHPILKNIQLIELEEDKSTTNIIKKIITP